MSEECRTLVIGLGNPILGDDGVGWRVVEAFQEQFERQFEKRAVEIDLLGVGGLSLMERMVDYNQVILVDAALTRSQPTGCVSSFPIEKLPNLSQGHLNSSHDTTLPNALAVGRQMGANLPAEIWVITIEAENPYEFSDQLTPAVALAVPQAVERIWEILDAILPVADGETPPNQIDQKRSIVSA
jgi:hydrogenase maturation protease